MHVKVGDIVRYGGIEQRLMMCRTDMFSLSHDGVMGFSPCKLRLVKSTKLPDLKVGDWVIVNNIPIEEKNAYFTPWYGTCEEIVTSGEPHQIEAIYDAVDYGKVIRLDQHMFLPYHLTKTDGYDMI